MATIWTNAIISRMTSMFERGSGYNDIASVLSAEFNVTITRNSIIGKSQRLGLVRKVPVRRRVPVDAQPKMSDEERRRQQNERQRKARAARAQRQQPVAAPQESKPPVDVAEVGIRKRVTFAEALDSRGCMFGFGHRPAMTFCGKKRAPGVAYCEHHAAICYRGVA